MDARTGALDVGAEVGLVATETRTAGVSVVGTKRAVDAVAAVVVVCPRFDPDEGRFDSTKVGSCFTCGSADKQFDGPPGVMLIRGLCSTCVRVRLVLGSTLVTGVFRPLLSAGL